MSTLKVHGTHSAPVQSQESKGSNAPARWYVRLQAVFWRFLMQIGMSLHRLAPPRPHKPAFHRQIPTTLSPTSGVVTLHFYTPKGYKSQRKLRHPDKRFPVLVNFHGGGFTLGRATDDARWATSVAEQCGAVVACVDYRLAPEFPFPTAVEDGVDAVLYIVRHAEHLHLDADRIAISGFSCGGNMAFTVPMRLMEEVDPKFQKVPPKGDPATGQETANVIEGQPSLNGVIDPSEDALQTSPAKTTSTHLHPTKGGLITASRTISASAASSMQDLTSSTTDSQLQDPIRLPPFKIVALASWYPTCDYTLTRENRRETLVRKDMEVSPVFTALFDAAYMSPQNIDKSDPFLSPGVANDALLRKGLPEHIQLYTCEWDMLRAEGLTLRDRLQKMGKRVVHEEVKSAPHGWDRSPNPFKQARGTKEMYRNACRELRVAFRNADEAGRRRSLADRLDVGGRLSLGHKPTIKESGSPPNP